MTSFWKNSPIMTNYGVFEQKFTTDHENESFNQEYQTKDPKRHHRHTKEEKI